MNIMKNSMVAVAALFAVGAAGAVMGTPLVGVAHAGCEAGVRIDNTTADQAKRRIEAAGYRDVHDLKKGCDNYWHSTALKDGQTVYVGVSPQGEVLREGG
jgi:hypothetical protein